MEVMFGGRYMRVEGSLAACLAAKASKPELHAISEAKATYRNAFFGPFSLERGGGWV
jgi:hypothetical protein